MDISKNTIILPLAAVILFLACPQNPLCADIKSHTKISATRGGLAAPLGSQFQFGSAMASIGDLNGDLVNDLAVHSTEGTFRKGAVYILFLDPNGVVKSEQRIGHGAGGFTGPLEDFDRFGSGITAAGDIDGDNVTDIVAGALGDDDGGPDRGAVWVLFMNNDGTVKNHQKISSTEGGFTGLLDDGDAFGVSVAALGDIDGDTIVDIAVGSYLDDDGGVDRGSLWILFLNADGTVKSHQRISSTSGGFTGFLSDGDYFGFAVSSLTDFDRDGVTDLIVGARGDDDGGSESGAVWVLTLNPDGTVKSQSKISAVSGGLSGLDAGDRFGTSLVVLGDMNCDGWPDVAAGAPFDDDGGGDTGAVWILLLGAGGTVVEESKISATRSTFSGGIDPDDRFGRSLANLLDVDAVGGPVFAVGASLDDDGASNAGATWILSMTSGCSVSQTVLDFGVVLQGGISDRQVAVRNTGCSPLTGTTQVACPGYTILFGGGPFTLAPEESLEVVVRFQPMTAPGRFDGVLEFGTDCLDIALHGLSRPPDPFRIYVDGSATGARDGSSWSGAFDDLLEAMQVSQSGDEIWVAKGTYRPTNSLDPAATFQLASGVELYGGFAGTETMIEERNTALNTTALDGRISPTIRVWHVVTIVGAGANTLIDGVTIRSGDALTSAVPLAEKRGGGVLMLGGSARINDVMFVNDRGVQGGGIHMENADAELTDVTFDRCSAGLGGGVFVSGGSLLLNGATFLDNDASSSGAGVHASGARLSITNSVFRRGETIFDGGGMYLLNSQATLVNVLFANNAALGGGRIGRGGAMVNILSNPRLVNVTFARNAAQDFGGAMYNSLSSPEMFNTIMWGNSANGISGVENNSSTPVFRHCLVEGSGGSAAWNPAFGADAGGNLDADPLFASMASDWRLTLGSPAIDTGDNAAPDLPTVDLDDKPRMIGPTVDIGAYEFGDPTVPATLLGFRSEWVDEHVVVEWTLHDVEGELGFTVLRKSTGRSFVALMHDGVEEDGNTFRVHDRSAELETVYTYMVTVLENGNPVTSFKAIVETPRHVFSLEQNVPNPFNPRTKIRFSLRRRSHVSLRVFDVNGQIVRTLVDKTLAARAHSAQWDGTNARGERVASGVYFYRLTAGERTMTKKMLVLK